MEILVGYTGFVGSNLCVTHHFDYVFNSKNIEDAFGLSPDLLVYSGVRAEMFLANSNPQLDLYIIEEAIENIKKINPQKIVLISTIAVYDNVSGGHEDTIINKDRLSAYGKNRLYLEEWVENNCNNYHIVRLPALYGINLKKNFIYDYIHFIPYMLKKEKYEELCSIDKNLENYYNYHINGFYQCKELTDSERKKLITIFKELEFSALNFTDSRNVYQFFNLSHLWDIIYLTIHENIRKLNIVTEPISIQELYQFLESIEFNNEVSNQILQYNLKTKYDYLFNSNNGYIESKQEILNDIQKYINNEISKLNGGEEDEIISI